jgi:hypothetical protein
MDAAVAHPHSCGQRTTHKTSDTPFLEKEAPFAAVFTEDEVREAQVRLRGRE